ncbi:hypothetical protein ANN_01194 [Periplaneta americana]|uniref:Uncharacterized protein n=1 Tax=Periplaneta americana TaxID=6978 RepID=A0ABQ8TWY4_PERAM|nr:hypothetical protein ANN_01194 [Periplaneta americana]
MEDLREGGNEPPGSLKAICKKKRSKTRWRIEKIEVKQDGEQEEQSKAGWKTRRWSKTKRRLIDKIEERKKKDKKRR